MIERFDKNILEFNKYLKEQAIKINTILIRELNIIVEELINHAKINAEYEDQTANLKSSIGGVLLLDGKPLKYSGFDVETGKEGSADLGVNTGNSFINSLISDYQKGYVILIVAGMEYAVFVENEHNLNVLKKSELLMKSKLPNVFDRVKKRIDKMK